MLDSSEAGASASEPAGTKLLAGRVRTDAAATLSSGAFVGEAAFTTPEESSSRVVTEGGVLVEVAPATRARVRSAALARVELMDGSVTGGPYGPDQAVYDEAAMQECVATIEAAGVDVPSPDSIDDPSLQPCYSAFFACPDVALTSVRRFSSAGEPSSVSPSSTT